MTFLYLLFMRIDRTFTSKSPLLSVSSRNPLFAISLILVLLPVLTGCSAKGGNSIPANVNNVYLAPFENESSEPGLENLITDEATQALLADGRVNLVSRKNADVIVRGQITNYQRIPLVYNDQDIVQLYKIRMEIDLILEDPKTGDILKDFEEIFRETRYSDVNTPIETELDAQTRVVRMLSRDVVTSVIEGWPYFSGENI